MRTEETTFDLVAEFITALGIVAFPFLLWIVLCS